MKKINVFIVLCAIAIGTFGFIKANKLTPVIGLEVGNKAPELSYNNPDGKAVSLANVNKGKYVLIDFWASWCGPCRMENPNVVKAYMAYKDKKFKGADGFTIYSVSLDRTADAWKQAIAKDGLIWDNHVSDLGFWQSAGAKLYGVQSIPTNFLIDPNGVILAKSLRGPALEQELDKYLASAK